MEADENLTVKETAFLAGWMDGSALNGRKSPYDADSVEDREYHRGYTGSICDALGEY